MANLTKGIAILHPLAKLGILALAVACTPGDEADRSTPAIATVVSAGGTHPTVAVSPATGRAYVAWVGSDANDHGVFLSIAARGSTDFSPPVRVNDIVGDAAPHDQAPAQVALGPGDQVYVLWQNNQPIEGRAYPASDLRLAVSLDGGDTFAPAVTVNDDAGGTPSSHTFHDLAVAASGTLFVSWIDSRRQDLARASIEADGAQDESGAGPDIRIATSADHGSTFSSSMVVDTDACPCCRTSLAIGPDESVYLAWRKIYAGDVRDVVVARAEPGALRFSEPVRVHHDGWVFPGCPHAGPSIVVDRAGALHAAWYTGEETKQGIWYARSDDDGRTFSLPTPAVTGEWVPPSRVVLFSSPGGEPLLAWEDRTNDVGTIVLARAAASGRPGLSPPIFTSPGRLPAIDGDARNAIVVWLDGEAIRARWTH